jgi:membrane-associated phospholipid phosphatase
MTAKMKYPVGALVFLLAFFMYHYTNHYPVFTPRELPYLWVDASIPFLPWTVLIYVSEYFFFAAVYLTCRDMENINKYVYSFLATQAFSCLIFLFWPTVFPRDLFPIPTDLPPFLQTVWRWLRIQDAATNCFPSLHVSTVYLSAYIFRDEQQEKFPFFITWGTLIALSTLPTKQHYFVDIIAGWLLSLVAYWLFHRKAKYFRVGPAALATSYQANR